MQASKLSKEFSTRLNKFDVDVAKLVQDLNAYADKTDAFMKKRKASDELVERSIKRVMTDGDKTKQAAKLLEENMDRLKQEVREAEDRKKDMDRILEQAQTLKEKAAEALKKLFASEDS